jgi:hypothetical protein
MEGLAEHCLVKKKLLVGVYDDEVRRKAHQLAVRKGTANSFSEVSEQTDRKRTRNCRGSSSPLVRGSNGFLHQEHGTFIMWHNYLITFRCVATAG